MKKITAKKYNELALLRPAVEERPYAVMECRDGKQPFPLITRETVEEAEQDAAWWNNRAEVGYSYEVYHITFALTIDALKADTHDRAHYAMGCVMAYLVDECTSLVEGNGSLVYGKMSIDDNLRYCRQRERYSALSEVLYVASTLAGIEVSVPDFPEPAK